MFCNIKTLCIFVSQKQSIMTNQSNYTVGQKVKDIEGNEFIIRSIIDNADIFIDASATLKGSGCEKEIGTLDLNFYTLVK